MKKLFLTLTIAALTASFVACDSKKSEPSNSNQDSTSVETTTPADTVAAEGDVLTKYTEIVEKAVALYPKVKSGDAAAIQEYTKISQEIAAMSQELQKEMANMTPEQTAKLAEIGKKFAELATK